MKQLVILTGPSGSGISSARYVFEEAGFYITENAPSGAVEAILKQYETVDLYTNSFCLMVNIPYAKIVYDIAKKNKNFDTRLILLTTSKETILSRYSLTRHVHPRSIIEKISLENAIDADLEAARELFPFADFSIDTSTLSVKELRKLLSDYIFEDEAASKTNITFMSFGLKNGIPLGLDMILDVRTLPNPYWVDDLRELTGEDQAVIDYLMKFPQTQKLLDEFVNFLTYQLEEVQKTGKASYNIGLACSGGQHRSTFVANYLASHFSGEYIVRVLHRDNPKGE